MFTFCDVLHAAKQKQTLESAQYGLEISFKTKEFILENNPKKI